MPDDEIRNESGFQTYRPYVRAGGVVLLCLIIGSVVRLSWMSRQENRLAAEAEARSELSLTIAHYCRSIRNYYPGNPYSSAAAQAALPVIDAMPPQEAERALKDVQASLKAVRSFYQPYAGVLKEIEEHLQPIVTDPPN